MREDTVGDLAIVLHSHMPYVEGFGTYPFGEEWLFDAVIRSYLPVLDVADRVTMTVTPVLADQLEDAGTQERLREFLEGFARFAVREAGSKVYGLRCKARAMVGVLSERGACSSAIGVATAEARARAG